MDASEYKGGLMSNWKNRTATLVAMCMVATAGMCPTMAWAQAAPAAADPGLLPLVPKQAYAVVENRGVDAFKAAALKSNLGKLATDDAIQEFVLGSKDRIVGLMANEMLRPQDSEQSEQYRKLLQTTLAPLWHCPCAMFLTPNVDRVGGAPGVGVICLTGGRQEVTAKAIDALTDALVSGGTLSKRFTYRKGATTWHGLIEDRVKLPEDEAERVKALRARDALLMVCWTNQLVCVATQIATADAFSNVLAAPGNSKFTNATMRTVHAKTGIKDWALRWFVDADQIRELVQTESSDSPRREAATTVFRTLELDKVRGFGGYEGVIGGVYARRSYIYAPEANRGVTKLFKARGSHRQASALTPQDCTITLAGQFDTKVLTGLVRSLASFGEQHAPRSASTQPAAAPKLSDEAERVLSPIETLVNGSDGHAAVYFTDMPGFVAGLLGGRINVPLGLVLHTSDPAAARNAVGRLMELDAAENGGNADGNKAKRMTSYRKVKANHLLAESELPLIVGVMDDRVIVATNTQAFTAAIDAALDKTGGHPADSETKKLLDMCGPGAMAFTFDIPKLITPLWPLLAQAAVQHPDDFPFATLPSVQKMARMLGPEVAVIRPDEKGVLFESRGRLPLVTKSVPMTTFGLLLFAWMR